jgi:hypothetical protein
LADEDDIIDAAGSVSPPNLPPQKEENNQGGVVPSSDSLSQALKRVNDAALLLPSDDRPLQILQALDSLVQRLVNFQEKKELNDFITSNIQGKEQVVELHDVVRQLIMDIQLHVHNDTLDQFISTKSINMATAMLERFHEQPQNNSKPVKGKGKGKGKAVDEVVGQGSGTSMTRGSCMLFDLSSAAAGGSSTSVPALANGVVDLSDTGLQQLFHRHSSAGDTVSRSVGDSNSESGDLSKTSWIDLS